MDKFGIFNLLTSFYDYYNKNKQNFSSFNNPDKNNLKEDKPDTVTAKTQENNQNVCKNKNQNYSFKNKMYSIMQNHDDLVKKILEKNKK